MHELSIFTQIFTCSIRSFSNAQIRLNIISDLLAIQVTVFSLCCSFQNLSTHDSAVEGPFLYTPLIFKTYKPPTGIPISKNSIMKLLLQSIGLLAAIAIALPSFSTTDPRCVDLERRLDEMAYLTNDFPIGNCTTDHCLASHKAAQALAGQINQLGCNRPDVDAAAQMERREEPPQYHSKCYVFDSHLVTLNEKLGIKLLAPSDEADRSYTYKCISVHESLPEIDIWSNRCASIAPTIGNATVELITSLQRLGCIWNTTCGPGCVQIGNDMFEAVRMMGPWQCNRFDSPDDPHKRDIERPTL